MQSEVEPVRGNGNECTDTPGRSDCQREKKMQRCLLSTYVLRSGRGAEGSSRETYLAVRHNSGGEGQGRDDCRWRPSSMFLEQVRDRVNIPQTCHAEIVTEERAVSGRAASTDAEQALWLEAPRLGTCFRLGRSLDSLGMFLPRRPGSET